MSPPFPNGNTAVNKISPDVNAEMGGRKEMSRYVQPEREGAKKCHRMYNPNGRAQRNVTGCTSQKGNMRCGN